MSHSSTTCIGHITEPEPKFNSEGTAYVKFSIAVPRTIKKDAIVDWIPCVMWGSFAEAHMEHLKKGRKIFVRGRIEITKGDKYTFFCLKVLELEYLDKKGKGA